MMNVSQDWIDMNTQPFIGLTTISGTIYDFKESIRFTYEKENFKSVDISEHGDLLCGSMTSIEGNFTLDNTVSGNIVSKDDIPKLNGLSLSLTYGFENAGQVSDFRFFIYNTELDSKSNNVIFKCKSVLAFMTAKYTGITTGSAAEIVDAVFDQAYYDDSVPRNSAIGLQYQYDESLQGIYITLQGKYRLFEVLQIVANACRCIVYIDRIGEVFIKPRDSEIKNYAIPRLIQYDEPVSNVDPPIRGAKVTFSSGEITRYSQSITSGQIETIDNLSIANGLDAVSLAEFVISELSDHPQNISVTYRADPRIELFDLVQVEYGNNVIACATTDIKLTYNGAWRGEFTGRYISDGIPDDDESIDVYNTMTEYLASVENGRGSYQPYTSDYDTFKAYIEGGE